MPFQVIPRERAFYDLLEEAAQGVVAASVELRALVDDLGRAVDHSARIRELEHQGDELTHQMLALLNTTFVTPLDRHDIHHLASSLDDVLDGIDAVADLLVLCRIAEPIPHLSLQVGILVSATEAAARAMASLRSPREADRAWVDIVRLEREGDHVYRRIVAELYSGDYQAMDVLKWRDIVEAVEAATDRCEDIANTIESVVLKHA